MASKKTLMTPAEVVQFSGLKLTAAPCDLRELYQIEYSEARNRIGITLYDAMIEALADYSAAPEWTEGTYNTGDVVKYKGRYYEVIADPTTTNVPTVATAWKVADKFTGDCAEVYEDLFCNYMAPFLANAVVQSRLPYIYSQIHNVGVINVSAGEYESVNRDQYKDLLTAVIRDKEVAYANMAYFLSLDENAESECLKTSTNDCSDEKTGREQQARGGEYRFG